MKYWYILLFGCAIFAQNDSINLLDEVKLYGNFSPKFNAGYQVIVLKSDKINKSQESLGNLLQNKANLYFKQNGNGMVSSISLRGSSASQTGVYWNGIAINSTLNGQTDFNTISARGYNQIEIRKGAGSAVFGSGAIGGAINLRDKIYYYNKRELELNLNIGSYNTQNIFVKTRYSNPKLFAKLSVEGTQSDNDFPYLNTNLFNENGAYKNYHLKSVLGYKIDKNNQLQLFSTISNNHRELSRSLSSPSNSKYLSAENRILVQWKNFGSRYNSDLKMAFLNEEYQFYFNKTDLNYSFGKSNNLVFKYDFTYLINSKINIQTGIENKFTHGNGTNIDKKERNNIESYLSLHHNLLKKLKYNLSIRKGFSNAYKIPFVFAIGTKYKLSKNIDLNANISTNYKLPTFNDLYWSFSGNENLLSERNKTAEIGINIHTKKSNANITSYFTKSSDLIQWRPVSSNFWKPINIQDVHSYGIETSYQFKHQLKKHQFNLNLQYSFTISEDLALKKQLIYVPYHKANATIIYDYKSWHLNLNQQYNGTVFTTTSNTQIVNDFWLSNFQIQKKYKKLNIGFSINNILNSSYQTVSYRPMPNRNFNLNINLKL